MNDQSQTQPDAVQVYDEERRHIRFPDPDGGVVYIVRVSVGGHESLVPALILDQSHNGLGCVLIGPAPTEDEIFWYRENDKIRTRIVARHSRELDPKDRKSVV